MELLTCAKNGAAY